MKSTFFVFILLLSRLVAGQYLEIMLSIEDEPSVFGHAILVDTNMDSTLKVTGDINGRFVFQNLKPSTYKLSIIPTTGVLSPPDTLLTLDSNDSLIIEVKTSLCETNYQLKPCPIHGSVHNIIRVDQNLRVSRSWSSEKAFNRFARKVQKQGYETTEIEGQEVLIYVHDESQIEMLKGTDICDQYLFCKRHKILFK